MTFLVASPESFKQILTNPLGVSLPSWGATSYSKVAEERISSLQKLTGAAISMGEVVEAKPKGHTIEGQLSEKLTSLKKLLSAVSMYLDPQWRAEVITALERFLDYDDWEDGLALPLDQSFAAFLRTVIYLHPTKRPALGLSAKGHFLASWSRDRDRIVIECLPRDEIRWVLSQTVDGQRESAAGLNQIHRLPDLIAGYEPDRLFQNGEKLLT